jgi:glutathione synthase
MYPWRRIKPETDTTLTIIHEAVMRRHLVALTTPNNLTVRNSISGAFCSIIRKSTFNKKITTFHRQAEFRNVQLPLAGFDAIIMRTNPPLDATSLNFLDSIKDDTFITNDIGGLRIANNKIYPASLNDPNNSFVPVTHVSKNKEYLEQVFDESPSEKMILKPLGGFGGEGVIVVEKRARQNFRSLLDFYIGTESSPKSNYVILQEYAEGAEEGDVRILMLNGEPIGAMRRVPSKNDIRSNIHAGGTAVKHILTRQEKNLCKHIGPRLVRDGLYFVGLDIINGKLIEVNVLSPGGIVRINRLNRVRLQALYLDFIENVVNNRDMIANRKNEFKKIVEDADIS